MPSQGGWRREPLALLIACLTALVGCDANEEPAPEAVVRDSAGVVIQEFPETVLEGPPLVLAGEPAVRIGVVEGAPEYQWTHPVAAARLADGGFAVLEQTPAEVRTFDSDGRFQGRIGTEGDGPGELRAPSGLVALPGDTILVWDRRTRRLTWFSRTGSVERELTVREPGGILLARRVGLSRGGGVAMLGGTTTVEDLANRGKVRESWQVVRLEPDGEGVSVGSVLGSERDIAIQGSATGEILSVNIRGRWWWGDGFAWGSTRGVWTADRLALEARHFDLENGLDRIVRINAEGRPFTTALIDSLHGVELERAADPEMRDRLETDFEGREYPPTVPPVAAVFADATGRVWIGLEDPPPERLPSGEHMGVRRWAVFEETEAVIRDLEAMRFAGLITLPARSHPLYADGEGVLLVRNDEAFDVAYVEWYPFAESLR